MENKSARELELEAEVAQLKEEKNLLEEKYGNLLNAYQKVGAEHFQLFNLNWEIFLEETKIMKLMETYNYLLTRKVGPNETKTLSDLQKTINDKQIYLSNLKALVVNLVNTKMEMVQQAQKGSQGGSTGRKDPKKS